MGDCEIIEVSRPLIPEGIYKLRFLYHETVYAFDKKVKLVFEVVTPGDYYGTELARNYNVDDYTGRPMRNGSFVVGTGRAFVREYLNVFGDVKSLRDIKVQNYEGQTINGRVRTVKRGARRVEIQESIQYSVIDELLELQQPDDEAIDVFEAMAFYGYKESD